MSTAKQLIEERVKSTSQSPVTEMRHRYSCMDTGMVFMTEMPAQRSPFTGGSVNEEEFQVMSDIPANQKNPMMQQPVLPNPVPAGDTRPAYPQNMPVSPNPAPDASGALGADQASLATRGFVPAKPIDVPPHKDKKPGERTDQAPAGSK